MRSAVTPTEFWFAAIEREQVLLSQRNGDAGSVEPGWASSCPATPVSLQPVGVVPDRFLFAVAPAVGHSL
jgi:hypothetical protein